MPTIKKLPKKSKSVNDDIARKNRMKIYNKQLWKDLRILKLQETGGLCQICLIRNKITPAEDCHHILTFTNAKTEAERDNLAFDYDNILPLCKNCHSELHIGKLKGLTNIEAIKRYIEEEEKKNPEK